MQTFSSEQRRRGEVKSQRSCGDSCVSSRQEERSGAPRVLGAEERRRGSLAVDVVPLSHFHHRILQPLERGENFREGTTSFCKKKIKTSTAVSTPPPPFPEFPISSTPGSVGDRHLALHRAFHPADKRRHSARSLERCGVLP